jgi:hypothetical protein
MEFVDEDPREPGRGSTPPRTSSSGSRPRGAPIRSQRRRRPAGHLRRAEGRRMKPRGASPNGKLAAHARESARHRAPKRGRWSHREIARLRELYGLHDVAWIARELDRPVEGVRRMVAEMFRGRARSGPWTAQEVERLKRYLGASAPEVIAQILGRSVDDVQARIMQLGRVQRSAPWTRPETNELKRVYGTRSDEDLARIFGRSVEVVRRRAEELMLAKDKAFVRRQQGVAATRMPRWSERELSELRQLYATRSNLDVAQALHRTVKSVVSKAHHLGLRKEAERLREMGRENVSVRYGERELVPAPRA